MWVCSSGDDALGTNGAIRDPSARGSWRQRFHRPRDPCVCPSALGDCPHAHLCTRRRSWQSQPQARSLSLPRTRHLDGGA